MDSDSPSAVEAESRFAQSDEEAARRFEKYESVDPFPDIPPALLNWTDIEDYVAATGMIWPFYPGPDNSKPASYEVSLLGKCVFWDEEGKKQIDDIQKGKEFKLRKNSIAFVTLEPMFRLPDYIALRFNLKITHVYRGILLGTGPLVDPGYKNKLSIPLHNLTANDYIFIGGEPLIWMEFTKLSPKRSRQLSDDQGAEPRRGEFPERKNKLSDVEDYLHKADPHRPIRSSIPDVIQSAARLAENADKAAKEAANRVETIQTRLNLAGIIGIATLIVAFYLGLSPIVSLIQDATYYVKDAGKEVNAFQREFDKNVEIQAQQLEKIQSLEKEVQNLKKQLEDLVKTSIHPVSPTSSREKTLTLDGKPNG